MQTETAFAEVTTAAAHTEKPLAGGPSAPLKIRHLILYGRASRDSLAACAAAKVWLESAVDASRRQTDRKAPRSALEGRSVRNYVIRFTTGGRTVAAAPGAASALKSVPSLGGNMYGRERGTDDIKGLHTGFAISVTLDSKRAGDVPGGIDHNGFPRHDAYFTAVSGSIIHCIATYADRHS